MGSVTHRERTAVLDIRDVSNHLDCDCCGQAPPGRSTDLIRRHPCAMADPETPGLQIVLCSACAQADPGRVAELVQLRRAWFSTAWKAGLRPSA
jgi:hypothetical protein